MYIFGKLIENKYNMLFILFTIKLGNAIKMHNTYYLQYNLLLANHSFGQLYRVCTACSKTSSCFYQRSLYCEGQHACILVEFLHAVHVPVLCDWNAPCYNTIIYTVNQFACQHVQSWTAHHQQLWTHAMTNNATLLCPDLDKHSQFIHISFDLY